MKKIYWILALLMLLILTSCNASSADYAWVLVDTVDYGASEEDLEKAHQNNVDFEFEANASQGNFSSRHTKREWGQSAQASFSTPPNTIRAGETVTLSFSMFFTENEFGSGMTQVNTNFDFSYGIVGPGLGGGIVAEFKNKNGESYFLIGYGHLDPQKDVLSLSETISATAPSGIKKGDKIAIHIQFDTALLLLGTRYIYEWKAQ